MSKEKILNLINSVSNDRQLQKVLKTILLEQDAFSRIEGANAIFSGRNGETRFLWLPENDVSINQSFRFQEFKDLTTGDLVIVGNQNQLNINIPSEVKSNNTTQIVDPDDAGIVITNIVAGSPITITTATDHGLQIGDVRYISGVVGDFTDQFVTISGVNSTTEFEIEEANFGGTYTSDGIMQLAKNVLNLSSANDFSWYSYIIFNGDVYLVDKII